MSFFFKPLPLTKQVLPSILKDKSAYGSNGNIGLRDPSDPSKGKKKIIVEFSSPNIAKPFHAGHLRSTIIGGFLAHLYAILGWEVVRINYLGDWGKQYGLLANGFKLYGSEEELQSDPINHLYEVYVRISRDVATEAEAIKELKEEIDSKRKRDEDVTSLSKALEEKIEGSEDEKARKYFKSMEDGDPDALALWQKFRGLSIKRYEEVYARLNIKFDVYSGESKVKRESMESAYKTLEEKSISEKSEGAVLVDFSKHGAKKLGKAVIVKKDGTPLYLTRDIGEIMERYEEFQFDKMLYVVSSQQDLHLAQLFKLTELMGNKEVSDKCQHINYGLVKGMSTRRGTVKFLDDILRDVKDKMHEVMKSNDAKYVQVEDPEKTADVLGISSVMVRDLKGKRYAFAPSPTSSS